MILIVFGAVFLSWQAHLFSGVANNIRLPESPDENVIPYAPEASVSIISA